MGERMTHAPLSPSAAPVWSICGGSINMPGERADSASSMEGTAAHEVTANVMWGESVRAGSITTNGICVTREMIEGAEMFAEAFPMDILRQVSQSATYEYRAGVCYIESPVKCPAIHPQCYGTPDAWYILDKCIYVKDYKFGFNYVDAFENEQGVAYIAGVLDTLELHDDDFRFEFTIVQPRCYSGEGPVRTWSGKVVDLRPHIDRLRNAAARAFAGDAPLLAGSHCKYCPAQWQCPAQQRAMTDAFAVAHAVLPAPMGHGDMAVALRFIDAAIVTLKSMQSSISEEAIAVIRSGGSIPGFGLEAGRGKLDWNENVSVEEIIAMGQMVGCNLSKAGTVTPTQAKKLGVDTSVISLYSSHNSGALKLTQTDESMTRRIFGGG